MRATEKDLYERQKELLKLIESPITVDDLAEKLNIRKGNLRVMQHRLIKKGVKIEKKTIKRFLYLVLSEPYSEAMKKIKFDDYTVRVSPERKIKERTYTGVGWFGILTRNEPIRI